MIVYMRALGYTYELIGELWGLSKERIRQILHEEAPGLEGRLTPSQELLEYRRWLEDQAKTPEDFGEYNMIRDRLLPFRPEEIERQIERYKLIKGLADQGLWMMEIARRTGLHWQTIRRFGVRYGIKFKTGRASANAEKAEV